MNKYKSLLSILFLVTISIMFIGLIFNKSKVEYLKLLHQKSINRNVADEIWKENTYKSIKKTIPQRINGFIDIALPFQETIINFYGIFAKLIGKNVIEDPQLGSYIIKLPNGQLSFFRNKNVNKLALRNLLELNNYCKQKNIPFFCIISPEKSSIGQVFPYNLVNKTPIKTDSLLCNLNDSGVNIINLKPYIENNIINLNNIFFNSDHHWRIETAQKISNYLIKYFLQKYGFPNKDTILYFEKNYKKTNISLNFVGSQGRRLGKFYSKSDTFNLILPTYETEFRTEYFRYNMPVETKVGNFYNSFINPICFKEGSPYDAYLSGNMPLVRIQNLNKSTGNKILIIKDSFAVPVVAFLASAFSEIHMIDLRYYFENDIKNQISSENFDFVWIFYNESSFYGEDDFFNFN